MSLLDRYGLKEVADVTFYELDPADHSQPGKPVLYLDTLKVSTVEQTAENAEVRGGKGNAALMAWDYGKEITVNLEDALFSGKSLEVMYGNSLTDRINKIVRTKYFKISNTKPLFIKSSGKWKFNEAEADTLGLSLSYLSDPVEITDAEISGTIETGSIAQSETGDGLSTYRGSDWLYTNLTEEKVPFASCFSNVSALLGGGVDETPELKAEPTTGKKVWAFKAHVYSARPSQKVKATITYSCFYTPETSVSFVENGKTFIGTAYLAVDGVKIPLNSTEITDFPTSLFESKGWLSVDKTKVTISGFHLFEIETQEIEEIRTLDISGNTFPGVYYVTAETFVRNEKTGKDEFFQLIFPKVKIVPETNTITLEAEGDPTVFNMKLKVLKDKQVPMMQLVKYKPGIYREASVAGAELIFNAPEGWVSEDAELPELPEDWEEFEGYDQDSGLYASAWCRTEAMQLADEEVLACAYGATRKLSDVVKFAPEFHTQRLQLGVTAVCYDGTENFVPNGNPSFTPNPVDRLPTVKNENLNVGSNYLYSQPVIEYTKEEKTHALTLFFRSEKGQTITNLFTSFTCVDTIQVVDNPVHPRVFEAFVGMDGTKDGSGVYHVGFTVYIYLDDNGKARLWGDVLFDVSWMVWTKQGRRWVLNRVWNIISGLIGGKITNLLKIDASKAKTIGVNLLVELGLGRLDGVIRWRFADFWR